MYDLQRRWAVIWFAGQAGDAETKHAFIKVETPEYNPYPNLQFGSD
ncbi:MAG: hypothetical protein ACQEVA_17870 [Myxococcota bacterium]